MSMKNQSLSILQQMEEGTREIYSQYEKLLQNAKAEFDHRETRILSEHAAAANAASARAKIDLKNTLEKMADSGFVRSGETVQTAIAHNAARNQALSVLDAQKVSALSDLERKRKKAVFHQWRRRKRALHHFCGDSFELDFGEGKEKIKMGDKKC
jgi:hypothetical protein